MKYTFILPAYKAKYLAASIHSILSQTYEDFVLYVSDDCSPENLKEIVDSFADDRVKYYRNESNIGIENLVSHWNKLLNIVNTEYVILAADDDLYDLTFLSEIDKLTVKYPYVNEIRARVRMIDYRDEVFWEDGHYEEYLSQLKFCYYNPNTCIANTVFKTQALRDNGGFINFVAAWGSDLATEMALSSKGVANTDKILFSFRQSGNNISSRRQDYELDKLKLKAVFQFQTWAKSFLCNIEYDHNAINSKYYDGIVLRCNNVVLAQCISSSWTISLIGSLRLFRKLHKEGLFYKRSKLMFFCRFVRSRFLQ